MDFQALQQEFMFFEMLVIVVQEYLEFEEHSVVLDLLLYLSCADALLSCLMRQNG